MQAVSAHGGVHHGLMMKEGLAPVDAVAVAAQQSGLFQQHAKLMGTTAGAAGYSSSGNSDGSLHHSRQPTPEAVVTDAALVVPDVAPCGHFAPSASPAPPVEATMPPNASEVAEAAMHQHQAAKFATLDDEIALPPATVAGVQEHSAVDGSSSPQARSEPEAPQPDTPRTAARKAAVGPPPSPLPPPSASEGPASAEEYEAYLRRFAEGVTLRQRWHRLALSGKVDDIRADWEEWQHDMALRELQQQIQQQGKGGRRRRDDADVDADAPRQTRQRRAPSTLHDYQVETPAAVPAGAAGGSKDEQQRSGKAGMAAGDDDGDASFSEGYEQEHGQAMQQQPRGRSQGRSRQPVPNRVIYHRGGAPYQEQQQFRQQHPMQQQWSQWPPQQQQQQQHVQQQQQQDAVAGAVNPTNVTPELMSHLYQMGTAMGQALQQQGGGAPGAHVSQMVQMCARMFGGDPAALVQHLMTQQVAAPHAAPQQQ